MSIGRIRIALLFILPAAFIAAGMLQYRATRMDRALATLGGCSQYDAYLVATRLFRSDKPSLERLKVALKDERMPVRQGAVQAVAHFYPHDALALIRPSVQDPEGWVRYRAFQTLRKLDAAHERHWLEMQSRDSNRRAKEDAIIELAYIGDKRAVDLIIAEMEDRGSEVRALAARQLGFIGDKRVTPLLLSKLDEHDFLLREAALRALGDLGDPRAVKPIMARIRRAAQEWVHRPVTTTPPGGPPEVPDAPRSCYEEMQALAHMGPQGAAALIELAECDYPWLRRSAISALPRTRNRAAYPVLIRALDDSDVTLRNGAMFALGCMRCKQAVPRLIELAAADDGRTREGAIEALKWIGDRRAVEVLLNALRDPSPRVRERAISAFCDIPDKRAVEPLIAALHYPDKRIRERAATALGYIGDRRALRPLMTALRTSRSWDWSAAVFSLARIHDPSSTDPLIRILRRWWIPQGRWFAARALGCMRDRRAVPALVSALKSWDAELRWQAALSLGLIQDERAVRPLIRMVEKESRKIGSFRLDCEGASLESAAWALGIIGGDEADEYLRKSLDQRNMDVISGASGYFVQKGVPDSEDLLIEALRADGSPEMARCYYWSGNDRLAMAARKYAAHNPDERRWVCRKPKGTIVRWGVELRGTDRLCIPASNVL